MKNKGKIDLDSIKELQEGFAEVGGKLADEANQLMDFLVNTNKDKGLENSLKNYLVIRYVSSIEYFFKNLLRQAIDNFSFDYKGILPKDEITIGLAELDTLREDKTITIGSIVSVQFNFQDLGTIDKVVSTFFNNDGFFKKFNERVELYKQEKENLKFEFDWEEFQKMFEFRHKIVHSMADTKEIDLKKVYSWYSLTNFFLAESAILLMKKYAQSDFISAKDREIIEKTMDMFSQAFITTRNKDSTKFKF